MQDNSGSMTPDTMEDAAQAAKAMAGEMSMFSKVKRGDRSYLAKQPSPNAKKKRKSKRKQQKQSRKVNRK